MFATDLPIYAVYQPLLQALREHTEVILQAAPGAGKTTQVPLYLLDQPWLAGQKIILLEPRRLAVRNAAERLAAQLGQAVGQRVGYRMRMATKVSAASQIEVVTEGVFLRMLQQDPSLEGVGLVIFDEFHERSLDSDLALALMLNGRELLRDTPLRLLIMSATLPSQRLRQQFPQAPFIESQGRQFPVTIHWGEPRKLNEPLLPSLLQTTLHCWRKSSGNLLVFLPGQQAIQQLLQALNQAQLADTLITPLYGELALEQQQQAIQPPPAGLRKIVLATNIAESSITIEGITEVIDSGLERVPLFDLTTQTQRLTTQRISQASAAQRAGRAGRIEPGRCYRLWSEQQHQQLPAFSTPAISQADLSSLALQLVQWGAEPDELFWLDPPKPSAYQQALIGLQQLGAIDQQRRLTAQGQAMLQLPVEPRVACLLLYGQAFNATETACLLAALLGERDILPEQGADLSLRIEALQGDYPIERSQQGRAQRIKQQAKRYHQLLPKQPLRVGEMPSPDQALAAALALAFPERIAQRTNQQGYKLANGRAAQFYQPDSLQQSEWLVIAELGSVQGRNHDIIQRALPLSAALFAGCLASLVDTVNECAWQADAGGFIAQQRVKVGALTLSTQAHAAIDQSLIAQTLISYIRQQQLSCLPWTPEHQQWLARIQLLHDLQQQGKLTSEENWPDVSQAALINSLEHWLLPFVQGVQRQAQLAKIELSHALHSLLSWEQQQQLNQLCPSHIQVPSGSNKRIDYLERPPVLAVRLQELFGLAQTPKLAKGLQPLKLHLLSPAQRPVQVTMDLASFWQNTYHEVKKDLKGRYPKHYWPDNPLLAEPTARAKPRN